MLNRINESINLTLYSFYRVYSFPAKAAMLGSHQVVCSSFLLRLKKFFKYVINTEYFFIASKLT